MGEWIDFAALKAAMPMEKLLEGYGVRLRRRVGIYLRGRCPLPQHSSRESSESFIVNTGKNVWICHSQSCAAARHGAPGGNVLDFVALMEDCSITEAARRLWPRRGAGGPVGGARQGTGFKKNEGAMILGAGENKNAALRFVLQPLDHAHPYLSQRGIDCRTAEYFQVGFYARAGLMQGRVVIPIQDAQGRLVGYAGRALNGQEPRYKFPRGFQKSLELFNLHRALRSQSRQVIVVEGFFDCMRVHQAGFPGVVALMGASLSRAQRQLLLDHFPAVVLMLDGDETGRRASRRIAAQLGWPMTLRVVEVPGGQQPDQITAMEIHRLIESSSKW